MPDEPPTSWPGEKRPLSLLFPCMFRLPYYPVPADRGFPPDLSPPIGPCKLCMKLPPEMFPLRLTFVERWVMEFGWAPGVVPFPVHL